MNVGQRMGLNRREFIENTAALTALLSGGVRFGGQSAFAETAKGYEKISLAQRVSPGLWQNDLQFEKLLRLLQKYRKAVDEVCLFEFEPTAVEPQRLAKVLQQLGERMAALRAAGFRPGINFFWTLGHNDIAKAKQLPFPPVVGHDGYVSNSCPCPNSPAFREYIRNRYQMVARLKPDILWIDDDFRLTHHGATFVCFCPICLEKFGRHQERQALVNAFNEPANGELREAWAEFGAASLESLAKEIGDAVRQVDPTIKIGLMTIGYSHSTYGGYPIRRWMKALGATRGRPGHGYYNDSEPRRMLNKTFDVGRQVCDYPAGVRTIQYELEDYPYIALDKAVSTVMNECSAALMMGCTGVAFNALPMWEGNLADYEPLMRGIDEERPLFERLREATDGLELAGLWPADTLELMTRRKVDGRGWFADDPLYDIQRPNQLAEMGIPFTTDPAKACGVILSGKIAEAFSDAELRRMLAGGLLLDAEALGVLWDRGFGDLLGVKLGEKCGESVYERWAEHPLNGDDAGETRDALIGPEVPSLTPCESGVASLTTLVNSNGDALGSGFSVFTNQLKGRIAVASYAPWTRLGTGPKQRQLRSVADWLSGKRLPVLLEQTARVAPLVRWDAERRRVVVWLLNMALDPTGPITMRLRAMPERLSLLTAHGGTELPVELAGNEVRIQVPSIPAWHASILISS